MKLSLLFIIACTALIGCAAGSEPADIDQPIADAPLQKAAPIDAPGMDNASSCKTYRDRAGNCNVITTVCNNNIQDIEVMCDRGRSLSPWEYIPDPPPPWIDNGIDKRN